MSTRTFVFAALALAALASMLNPGHVDARQRFKPNLVPVAAEIGQTSLGPNNFAVFVTIRNESAIVGAGPFTVEFDIANRRSSVVTSLGRGETVIVQVPFNACQGSGVITVDSNLQIDETSESDNTIALSQLC